MVQPLSCGADATRQTTQDLLLAIDEMGSVCLSDGDLLPLAPLGSRAGTMTATEIEEGLTWRPVGSIGGGRRKGGSGERVVWRSIAGWW